METPSTSIRELARKVLNLEAASGASDSHPHEAVRVVETLRISLTRFAGTDGFATLMRRALVLSRAEDPSLTVVKIKPDGSIDGIEAIVAGENGNEAASTITAHLLFLLVTFIGEPMTMRLVLEAWPDLDSGD